MVGFPIMALILGLFAGGLCLYIFKIDKSITPILHAISYFALIGLLFYTYFTYIIFVLIIVILTIAYTLLCDRGFYKRVYKKCPKLDLISRIFLLVWIVVTFILYYIFHIPI